jgi:hypothetical protein
MLAEFTFMFFAYPELQYLCTKSRADHPHDTGARMDSRTASTWGVLGGVSVGLFTAMLGAGSPAFAQQPAPQTVMSPGNQLLLQRLQAGL